MANRILRDWTDSETINKLCVHSERFFTRLIMKADDFGCYTANLKLLKSSLFPLLIDEVREADITRWMAACQKAGVIVLYEVGQRQYLQIVEFKQRLRQATHKYPPPIDGQLSAICTLEEKRSRNEEEVEVETKGGVITPSLSDRKDLFMKSLAEYVNEFSKETVRAFFDYWTECNEGGKKMRFEMEKVFERKKRLTTWKQREKNYNGANKQNSGANGIVQPGKSAGKL